MKRILIIKHGSLGDIVFSLPVMQSIRSHFPNASIDLLTQKNYIDFLIKTNHFSNLIEDNRSNNIFLIISILYKLIKNKYEMIIDLQNSTRTSFYHLFFRIFTNTKISSSRRFSHFRYIIPEQGVEKATQGLFNQLKLIGIHKIDNIHYNWLETKLDERYDSKIILFIPGVSSKGKYKQWKPKNFAEIAKYCEANNYKICIVGTKKDYNSIEPITNICNNLINYIDRSPPEIIYSIAKISKLIITNDTGPGHIASLAGSNILWLVNDNQVTKANISNQKNNYKISSMNLNEITVENVINYIKENNLI